MKNTKITLIPPILIMLLLTSCVTLPAIYNVDAQKTLDASSDIVWSGLMQFFTENNIQIKTIEKDSGVVYAERIYSATSTSSQNTLPDAWFDCGRSDMETPVSSTLSLNVFVRDDLKKENTTVSINAVFSQKWYSHWDGRNRMIPCNSTGTLEVIVLDYISKYIEEHNVMKEIS